MAKGRKKDGVLYQAWAPPDQFKRSLATARSEVTRTGHVVVVHAHINRDVVCNERCVRVEPGDLTVPVGQAPLFELV